MFNTQIIYKPIDKSIKTRDKYSRGKLIFISKCHLITVDLYASRNLEKPDITYNDLKVAF